MTCLLSRSRGWCGETLWLVCYPGHRDDVVKLYDLFVIQVTGMMWWNFMTCLLSRSRGWCGETLWLVCYPGHGDDVVKLYDLFVIQVTGMMWWNFMTCLLSHSRGWCGETLWLVCYPGHRDDVVKLYDLFVIQVTGMMWWNFMTWRHSVRRWWTTKRRTRSPFRLVFCSTELLVTCDCDSTAVGRKRAWFESCWRIAWHCSIQRSTPRLHSTCTPRTMISIRSYMAAFFLVSEDTNSS